MSIFEKALGYIAGYGMRALIITQDRSQLLAHYGKDESITANCHIRVAFAPNEPSTAKWISEILGRQTVVKESFQTSGKRSSISLSSVSSSISEVARPLMTPDEVMRLRGAEKDIDGRVIKGGELLIMPSGAPPIRANQAPYFLDREFLVRVKGRAEGR
jgi:type IV secretion system protein VirD4